VPAFDDAIATDTTNWIAATIREHRDRRGWSQAELARRLGRTQTSLSYWETGKRSPALEDLFELAGVLDVDVETFIPPGRARRPAPALLRATAERLASSELQGAVEELLARASAQTLPRKLFDVRSSQPAYAANQLIELAKVDRPPVDVQWLANQCGALVIRCPMPDALSGLVFAADPGAVIGINDGHHPNRQRFSLAHELGHFLLSHHERDGSANQGFHLDVADSTPPGYDWRLERAANDFAADLLMPRRLVEREHELRPDPGYLARTFEVSEIAMGYRLVDLGLL
jgi:Zn-dependent peptidase ImmA (M78 family)/DNA-binding XRE family transcriptional regulator